jgi:hypothetical protein
MNKNYVLDPQGKKTFLDSLPLVAYQLYCGHYGKDYGVQRLDLMFCETCGHSVKIRKILAT